MTSERVEKIAAETVRALARKHLLSGDQGPWSPRFERQVFAFVDAIVEQVAALDGARTVEWGVRDTRSGDALGYTNESYARWLIREVLPSGTHELVRRYTRPRAVGEWEVAG